MPSLWAPLLALFAVSSISIFYLYSLFIQDNLSPQGCRMSRMYPSYILQSGFDEEWTPLAKRYSLWLYREGGLEGSDIHRGSPVLFIPGNAGSSRQVRSIASSAARQYFVRPDTPDSVLEGRGIKPLDIFAVEFNEDLSAFHGPTLAAEIGYTSRAIDYILELYPANTSITILGHSMGGIVATSLLPSSQIAAIITMSTPHRTPPARFDHRVDEIYDKALLSLRDDPTPIVSLCGGATDMMIPSEFCILPTPAANDTFRRTVFSSALEGSWTGVGHREMVWCHQVRWRVAKAALELTTAHTYGDRADTLDTWLRDGRSPPNQPHTASIVRSNLSGYEVLQPGQVLTLQQPAKEMTYLLPVEGRQGGGRNFVLLVSEGSVPPVAPQHKGRLRVSVSQCSRDKATADIQCRNLQPITHKLLPHPVYGRTFPVPNEGADESEGVVLYEADLRDAQDTEWVAVTVEATDGKGWIVAGIENQLALEPTIHTTHILFRSHQVSLPRHDWLKTSVNFSGLESNALIVYRVVPSFSVESSCGKSLMAPLLEHRAQPTETHYFALSGGQNALIHSHGSAPHAVNRLSGGVNLVLYSSGNKNCLTGVEITVDWKASLGRWATRYFTALAVWGIALVSLVLFQTLGLYESTGCMPIFENTFSEFCTRRLPTMLLGVTLASLVPLPDYYFLGNGGNPQFVLIAPLLLLVAAGTVYISWWIIFSLVWIFSMLHRILPGRRTRETADSVRRSTLISMAVILGLVLLVIPWQVAFLVCWVLHLQTCASMGVDSDDHRAATPTEASQAHISIIRQYRMDNFHLNMHLLLFFTWLLPLAAPVLVVWVRTLATAGITTPFDGDHFCLNVAPFLILVDFASWSRGPILERQRFENRLSLRWGFVIIAIASFIIGPRKAYIVFDSAKICIGILVAVRIAPRYLGSDGWPSWKVQT